MLPVIMAGYPWRLIFLDHAKQFASGGGLVIDSHRLMPVLISVLSPLVGWNNSIGWSFTGSIILALALIPWWILCRKLFDAKVAWGSTTLFALMPLTWLTALRPDGYSVGYLFVFLSSLALICFYNKRKTSILIIAGLLFGGAMVFRDVFILFLPWMFIFYLWTERKKWKGAFINGVIFIFCSGIIFSSPFIAASLKPNQSLSQRTDQILKILEPREPGWSHYYPDRWTYEFEKDLYDQISTEKHEGASKLEQIQNTHYRFVFGVDELSPIESVLDGAWLFVNRLPTLFMQEEMGGAFLWLFIIPGILILWRKNRKLLIFILGIWFTNELIVRFGFHYQRSHLMNYHFVFALLAGVGIAGIGKVLAEHHPKISTNKMIFVIVLIASAQLVQANRGNFAKLYARSTVPMSYAAAEQLNALPEDSVVAFPIAYRDYFYFWEGEKIYFHLETVDRIIESGKLKEAFDHYGVTHVVGYPKETNVQIRRRLPRVVVLEPVKSKGVEVSPVIRYLLHLVR